MPLSKPIHGIDGTLMNEVFVPRGTLVLTGNWASNTNKELWGEDADQWKPERWLSPLPDALKEARIPGVYSNLSVWFLCMISMSTHYYLFLQDDFHRG